MCMLTHGNVAVMQYWTVDEAWLSNCVISSVVPGNTSSSEWNPYSQKQQDGGREREGESVYCTCPEHVQSLLIIVCQGCTSVLVLKSALTNFSEVLDGAFKHLISWSTCAFLQYIGFEDKHKCFNHTKISWQLYMLWKNCLHHSFSSKWWVYWYELFSVLRALQK